jgi:beta-lactamase class A
MDMLRRTKWLVVLIGIALCVGFIGGYFFSQSGIVILTNSIKRSLKPITEEGTAYTFVNPILAYRTPEATLLGEYVSLKSALQSIVNTNTQSGTSSVAVYFRDLGAGSWVGINQDATYYPASLLKVPIMIAFYKQAERNPSALLQHLTYDPNVLPDVPFDAPSTLVPSRAYSLQELITHMITDSDNGATFTLLKYTNPEYLHAVYTSLGITDPGDDSASYKISARTYGLFFRIL